MTTNAEQIPTAEGQSPGNPSPNPARSHRELNNRAMDTAMLAAEERGHGRSDLARYWYRQALHHEMENLARYYWEQGLLPSITHRSAGWLAMNAGDPALARDLALRGLSIEPHPMIKPELEDLLAKANCALNFPKHPGHGNPIQKDPPLRGYQRHPGPSARTSGHHGHHAGYPDSAEWHSHHRPPNSGTPTETPPPSGKEQTLMHYPLKRFSDRAAAEDALEEIQLDRNFQDAFLVTGIEPSGRTEYLIGIRAPRHGRMLLIDEDQMEAAWIDSLENGPAPA